MAARSLPVAPSSALRGGARVGPVAGAAGQQQAARGAEGAAAGIHQKSIFWPGSGTRTRAAGGGAQWPWMNSAGVPRNMRGGAVVHRDRVARLDHVAHGDRGVLRAHGEVAADRDQHEVGLVRLADQLHVAEQAGIAHVPDLEAVLHLDDVAHRLAAEVGLLLVGGGVLPDQFGGVLGMDRRDLRAGRAEGHDGAALAEALHQCGRQDAAG